MDSGTATVRTICESEKDLTIREFVQFLTIAFGEDSDSMWCVKPSWNTLLSCLNC